MKRFLVFKIGAIGDVLLSTPLVRLLHGEGEVDYLVGRNSAGILGNNPDVRAVYTFDESILLQRRILDVLDVTAPVRPNAYDAVFVLDKHWIFSLLATQLRGALRVGFKRGRIDFLNRSAPFGKRLAHDIDLFLSLAEFAGIPAQGAARSMVCEPGAADMAYAESLVARPYVVACNSGGNNVRENSTVRRLPAPLFGDIVRMLAEKCHVVFVGAASESGQYREFAGANTTNLCGRTGLLQAAAVLRNADRVLTTEGGIMHIAAAVNRRVLAIFGPTHPLRRCPPGAAYIWEDEPQYSFEYEDYGIVPTGSYFASIDARRVVERFENL